jgi:hypothetical protein
MNPYGISSCLLSGASHDARCTPVTQRDVSCALSLSLPAIRSRSSVLRIERDTGPAPDLFSSAPSVLHVAQRALLLGEPSAASMIHNNSLADDLPLCAPTIAVTPLFIGDSLEVLRQLQGQRLFVEGWMSNQVGTVARAIRIPCVSRRWRHDEGTMRPLMRCTVRRREC